MNYEPSFLEDLLETADDMGEIISQPGWAGTFLLAIIVLIVGWLVLCTTDAYIGG